MLWSIDQAVYPFGALHSPLNCPVCNSKIFFERTSHKKSFLSKKRDTYRIRGGECFFCGVLKTFRSDSLLELSSFWDIVTFTIRCFDEIALSKRISWELFSGVWYDPINTLPEDPDRCVLAIVNGKIGEAAYLIEAFELVYYSKDGKWYSDRYEDIKNLEVLFWMPLPKSPFPERNEV